MTRTRKGSLSEWRRPPRETTTFDWDEARRKYLARIDDQIARGVDDAETRAHIALRAGEDPAAEERTRREERRRARRAAARSPGVGRGKLPQYDRDLMVRLYVEENMPVKQVAIQLGCTERTVVEGLRAREVYRPGRDADKSRGGRPPNGTCSHGHDQALHRRWWGKRTPDGVPLGKAGGWYCGACRDLRTAEEARLRELARNGIVPPEPEDREEDP